MIKKEETILLWMAEGFLGDEKMREWGDKCFDDLVSRSFLQGSSDRKCDNQSCFLMHDLINDSTQHICGEFLVRLEGDSSCKIGTRERHFSLIYKFERSVSTLESKSEIPEGIYQAKLLRTFLPLGLPYNYPWLP